MKEGEGRWKCGGGETLGQGEDGEWEVTLSLPLRSTSYLFIFFMYWCFWLGHSPACKVWTSKLQDWSGQVWVLYLPFVTAWLHHQGTKLVCPAPNGGLTVVSLQKLQLILNLLCCKRTFFTIHPYGYLTAYHTSFTLLPVITFSVPITCPAWGQSRGNEMRAYFTKVYNNSAYCNAVKKETLMNVNVSYNHVSGQA